MKPEWVIYKNDQRIGQAVTWHKALDIAVQVDALSQYEVKQFSNIVYVYSHLTIYKIVKER